MSSLTLERHNQNEQLPWEEQIVIRVDAGWSFVNIERFIPISEKPFNFAMIDARVRSIDCRSILKHMWGYNSPPVTWESAFYKHVWGEELSKICTPYSFHMYLRWCDMKGVFQMKRKGGEVAIIEPLWGPMGPQNVGQDAFANQSRLF